jgi:hypothetical protein
VAISKILDFLEVSLTSYHRIPSNCQKEDGDISNIQIWVQKLEELDYETEGIRYNADSGNKHTPKVEAMVSLEGNKYQDD